MPAPDPAWSAQVESHLEGCAPCRIESETLKEINRRLLRLAEARRAQALLAWQEEPDRFDELFGQDVVMSVPARPKGSASGSGPAAALSKKSSPFSALRIAGLLMLLCVAGWWLLQRLHR